MKSNSEESCRWNNLFVRCWAATNLFLVGLTWKLWFPGFADFPRVPVISIGPVASPLQWLAGISVVACFVILLIGGAKKSVCLAVAASFLVLFLCNQHCLQPWAWQAFIFAILFGAMDARESKTWIARVVISIYLYSAIGKFDYQFANTLGIEFVDVLLSWIGFDESPGGVAKSKIALLFPAIELLIGPGLMFQKSQKLSGVLAIALHVGLIAILSPAGLGHRWPVIVWNGLSIVIVVWLFLLPVSNPELHRTGNKSVVQKLATAFAMLILFGPLLRPVQLWDHWLAWGLYSPSNSRVELFVADNQLERFRDLEPYVVDADDFPGSSRFAMERWSLDSLGVPIYPEARIQKEVAVAWLERLKLTRFARVIELGPSHPWTGRRSESNVALSE